MAVSMLYPVKTTKLTSVTIMWKNIRKWQLLSGEDLQEGTKKDVCVRYVWMSVFFRISSQNSLYLCSLLKINMARWSPYQHQRLGTCNWEFFSKCETNYGACVPSRGTMTPEGKPVKCHWRQSPLYTDCIDSLL